MTATLLTVDAWFDTMTATGANARRLALEMAIGGELPLAAFCARLAARGLRRPRGITGRGSR